MPSLRIWKGRLVKPAELWKAKNPDLRASLVAMRRAAELARKVAMETNTNLVVLVDGKVTRISAEQLRALACTRGAEPE